MAALNPTVRATDAGAHCPALRRMPDDHAFFPTLLSTAVIFVTFAVMITITLYLAEETINLHGEAAAPTGMPSWWNEWKHLIAPAVGTLVPLIAACLFAEFRRDYAQADRADPQVCGELRGRLGALDARLPVLCPRSGPALCDHGSELACKASCDEARARMEFINVELASRGSRWILGTGYIDLYRQLHAAEEALFLVEPSSDVVGNALFDELRLEGASNVPDQKALQIRLRHAITLVAGSGVLAVTELPSDLNGVPETSTRVPTPEERSLGRVILRDIRRSINAFRDGQRANLVRARNQLVWTGTITALGGYGLLALAVIAQAPPFAVLSGIAYGAVGSIVGLFNQLRGESSHGAGEEDFGFSRARLLYTPILSGFAAIGGVLVVSLLYETVDFHAGDNEVRSLQDIFNIRLFGLGLVIAAVFGLTPDLLVDQLQHKADEYRAALKGTSPGASGTPSL